MKQLPSVVILTPWCHTCGVHAQWNIGAPTDKFALSEVVCGKCGVIGSSPQAIRSEALVEADQRDSERGTRGQ